MSNLDFKSLFRELTGNEPLRWQHRLFHDHFACDKNGSIPRIIDLPTGLGKTMVMAIWLIARSLDHNLPRRLIYVVDRRTVVDQATDLAEKLVENWKEKKIFDTDSPAISTLRGQLADNRQWSRDPSRPAIIIGTVDLIGSALLFSGYRSSYKRRPLEAGLLGQDSLLVLDEAHLSRPFEKLLDAIDQFNECCANGDSPVKPMRVIRMSATSGNSTDSKPPFTLQLDADGNLTGEDAKDEIVAERFRAEKRLTITTLGQNDNLVKKLANAAIELAANPNAIGKRIAVFVKKPKEAKDIADLIRKYTRETLDETGPKPKKTKSTPYVKSVEVLTGRMRGLERDKLVEKPVFQDRWLNGDLKPDDPVNQSSVFLISTSAGEVGFDLNADHLIGDDAPLDSWIQRLGRVNRRGKGTAIVQVFVKLPSEKKKEGEAGKHSIDGASANAITALKQLPKAAQLNTDERPGPIFDASPWALRNLAKPDNALSPTPTNVELTDILLDAWSMTSIIQPMPGRPEVGPWLRGITEWEPPQTTIAWRLELDEPGFAGLDLDDVQEWFDTHRILSHETLSVPTDFATKQLLNRWSVFEPAERAKLGDSVVIIDRAGIKAMSLAEFIQSLERDEKQTNKTYDTIRFAELILPASLGAIERGKGLLDATAPETSKDEYSKSIEEQQSARAARLVAPDVADIAPDRQQRMREIVVTNEDGERERRTIGGGTKPGTPAVFRLMIESDDDKTVRLVSYVPRREKQESGSKKQTLMQHVGAVREKLDGILSGLKLPGEIESTIQLAAQLAADWHDHGKNREFFERTVGGTPTETVEQWQAQTQLEGDGKHQCLGKSDGQDRGRPPRGYRHEFGSLREFTDAFKAGRLLDNARKPINQDTFDLAMHLIATHHGRGRPHFPKGGFDPLDEPRSEEIHADSIRRFARLQRKYGWWYLAWLENLLRCADALASADQDTEDDPIDSEGGAA